MATKIEDALDIIKGMTIVELRDLNSAIEEEFGVTAAAPVAMAAPAADGGGPPVGAQHVADVLCLDPLADDLPGGDGRSGRLHRDDQHHDHHGQTRQEVEFRHAEQERRGESHSRGFADAVEVHVPQRIGDCAADDQPEQSYSERQIFEAASSRLARELAAMEETDEPSALQKILRILNEAAPKYAKVEG